MAQPALTTDPTLRARLADGSLAGTWALDSARSTVTLRSKSMWGLAPVKGVFGEISGEATVSGEGAAAGTITVRAASIDTKVKKRDAHLRSADFFASDEHPDIVFTVERVTLTGQGATVTGSLRVRDRTLPLTFPIAVSRDGDAIAVAAEVIIDRSDFGLTWNQMGMASMKNTLSVRAIFTRQ